MFTGTKQGVCGAVMVNLTNPFSDFFNLS